MICPPPAAPCSSSRKRPSFVAHRRPVAPASSGELPGTRSEPTRRFVNAIRAVTPSRDGAAAASASACARGFAGGFVVDADSVPAASATEAMPTATSAVMTAIRRLRDVRWMKLTRGLRKVEDRAAERRLTGLYPATLRGAGESSRRWEVDGDPAGIDAGGAAVSLGGAAHDRET